MDCGKDCQDDNQEHCDGGGVAHLQEGEALLVDVVVNDANCGNWVPGVSDLNRIEDLEGSNQTHDEDQNQNRTQKRKRNPEEHSRLTGAI